MKIFKLLLISILSFLLFACGKEKPEEAEKVEQIF